MHSWMTPYPVVYSIEVWFIGSLMWSPESCVTAAWCFCACVVHWKVKVTSSLTDVWQQLFEQQDIIVIVICLRLDLIWCYKILFGLISIDSADLFEVRQATATRIHPYKLFKPQCTINARSSFFTQRIINVWNDLPVNTTNFSSLNCLRNSLNKVDLSSYLVLG